MESFNTTKIIRTLAKKSVSLFSLSDFAKLFNIKRSNTLYKKIQRLEKNKIIQKLASGKYLFLLNPPNDYLIANYLYHPSYISLESALSFYGMITGFPYKIVSVTCNKSKSINIKEKEFQYCRISQRLFWGYEKKEDFLIAEKEKALLDYLYFGSKGLRSIDWEEIEITGINKGKLINYARRFGKNKLLPYLREKIL